MLLMEVKSSRLVWTIHYTEDFRISSLIGMIGQKFQIQTLPIDYAPSPPARQGWASKETRLNPAGEFILSALYP
jgi:hypothetical protein